MAVPEVGGDTTGSGTGSSGQSGTAYSGNSGGVMPVTGIQHEQAGRLHATRQDLIDSSNRRGKEVTESQSQGVRLSPQLVGRRANGNEVPPPVISTGGAPISQQAGSVSKVEREGKLKPGLVGKGLANSAAAAARPMSIDELSVPQAAGSHPAVVYGAPAAPPQARQGLGSVAETPAGQDADDDRLFAVLRGAAPVESVTENASIGTGGASSRSAEQLVSKSSGNESTPEQLGDSDSHEVSILHDSPKVKADEVLGDEGGDTIAEVDRTDLDAGDGSAPGLHSGAEVSGSPANKNERSGLDMLILAPAATPEVRADLRASNSKDTVGSPSAEEPPLPGSLLGTPSSEASDFLSPGVARLGDTPAPNNGSRRPIGSS